MKTLSNDDLIQRTRNLKTQMHKLIKDLRADVGQLPDPQARALFETSAEVITGLTKAFDDYEEKEEAAWQNSES